jgi:hypothetical protein
MSTTTTKTFLPQEALIPLWKDGFETWHIAFFLVGLTGGNIFLLQSGMIDHPNPGKLPIDDVFNPSSNPVFRIFLLTSIALFVKTHAVAWAQVWLGCKNNSFSKNVWDKATGSTKVEARTTEQDLAKYSPHIDIASTFGTLSTNRIGCQIDYDDIHHFTFFAYLLVCMVWFTRNSCHTLVDQLLGQLCGSLSDLGLM